MNMLYNAYQENIDCQRDNKRDQTVRNKKSLSFFYFFYFFFCEGAMNWQKKNKPWDHP